MATNGIVALGAVTAALIAGIFSFLNLVISKEQKVSEFRQDWINNLRLDVANYIAAVRFVANYNIWHSDVSGAEAQYRREDRERLESSYLAVSRTFALINLRLNPAERDLTHKELNEKFIAQLNYTRQANREYKHQEAADASDKLVELAQPILKIEWNRVKSGEPIYRWSRNTALIGLLLAVGLIAYLFIMLVTRNEVRVGFADTQPTIRSLSYTPESGL